MTTRIGVVATGGTIQNTLRGRVPIEAVIERIGSAYQGVMLPDATYTVRDILRAGSETFGPAEWHLMASTAQDLLDDDAIDAVVVTHGTFTAEESAYLLHLVLKSAKPIVVTVSQRKHATLGNDGDRNLVDAIRTACSPSAGGLGVLVVANEEIHSAREVTKENQRPGAFSSPPLGALGTIETDAVSLYRAPLRLHTMATIFHPPLVEHVPRVDIVAGFAGADGASIKASVAAGARGIVLAGFAYSGRGSDEQMAALRRASEAGVAVILASRGRGGRIPSSPEHPFVRADNLTPQKARILTALALAAEVEPGTLQTLFDRH